MKESPFETNTLQALSRLVEQGPGGNRWFKVNLHTHARGHAPDEIVRQARIAEIDLLAITDHQTFEHCDAVTAAAKTAGRPLTVLAGIEITAHEGVHVIAIFPPGFSKDDQSHFIGWLNIPGTGDTRTASPQKVIDIFARVHQVGGVVVIPHPFTPGIGLLDSARKISTKLDWLESGHIQLVQIEQDKVRFVDRDDRGNWINRYVLASASSADIAKSRYCLAPFSRTDAHKPSELPDGCSWFRMQAPSVEGLRQVACEPHTRIARVKPPAEIHACILGLRVQGGYCDGQFFQFNGQLNCVVGQNYAGKSAVFDLVRFGLGQDQDISDESRNVLLRRLNAILGNGGAVELFVRFDGNYFGLKREFNPRVDGLGIDATIVTDDKVNAYQLDQQSSQLVPVEDFNFPIEVYEQGRIHRLREDIGRQLEMLDEFAGIHDLKAKRADLIRRLNDSAEKIAPLVEEKDKLSAEVVTLEALKKELAEKEKLLPGEEEQHFGNSVSIVEAIETAITELQEAVEAVPESDSEQTERESDLEKLFTQNAFLIEPDKLVEPKLVSEWNDALSAAVEAITKSRSAILETVRGLGESSKAFRQKWKVFKDARDRKVSTALAKAGVQSPQEIIQRVNFLRRQVQLIEQTKQPRLTNVRKQLDQHLVAREKLLDQLEEQISLMTTRRREKADELTETLGGQIKVSLQDGGNTVAYTAVLNDLCNRISNRDRKISNRDAQIAQITKNVSPIVLSRALMKDGAIGTDSNDSLQKKCSITKNTQEVLCVISTDFRLLNKLQTVIVEDVPRILVRRRGEMTYADLSTELSQGEQSAAILTLVLQTRSMPLLLDQPEDELGYSYVVHLIVPKILSAKTTRQIMIVTHNANIPVLGDADYVVQMENQPQEGGGRRCVVAASGCFENPAITHALVELEGGKQAFQFRQHRYGLQD